MTRLPQELVRERRIALGLTQAEAAERAGISRNEWNQMEKGGRGIGPRNAERLARVLGGAKDEYLTRPVRNDIKELRSRIAVLERQQGEMARDLERLKQRVDT